MSTEILVDTVTTTTDSCQMVATETTLQVTAATKSDNQTTANEAYTAVPPRRTFNEQKPFVFSIVGFAVVYVAALVIGRIIKMRMPHHLKEALTANKKQVTEMITHSDDLSPLNTFKQNGKICLITN